MNIADAILAVCKETHVPMVEVVFGRAGVDAAFAVMEVVRGLFKYVEPERVTGEILVFQAISATNAREPAAALPPADFATLANSSVTNLVVEVGSDGNGYIRADNIATPEELAKQGVVYRFTNGIEEFLAGTERKRVLALDSSARSQFSVPTLSNLRAALRHYEVENIRESTCHIFEEVWFDKNKVFFKAGPEERIRRSLTQFLRNRLGGDHDVWPEQNVDESHPVDIQVKPRFSNNRLMLIEIKWLGYSVAPDGHITARHRERRAQEGAEQLAQYLEDQRRFAPSTVIQGYYVIIDGRRQNLQEGQTSITKADGMFYETRDIAFSPAPHLTRPDFDHPYRMFAKPICSD